MELEQAKKRVEELRAVIEKNNRLYYDQDAPELEDFEYDALTRELKELEAQSAPMPATTQISFFDSEIAPEPERVSEEPLPYEDVLKEIRGVDINSLTPIQALVRLQEIQNEIKDIDEDSEE